VSGDIENDQPSILATGARFFKADDVILESVAELVHTPAESHEEVYVKATVLKRLFNSHDSWPDQDTMEGDLLDAMIKDIIRLHTE